MTSSEIRPSRQVRQDFLDFFQSKPREHTIVPSDSVGYQSRDGAKIFTNAGMNQFVPIFLGERKADVDKWGGVIPGMPTRAADTQKCIRAGGKHNDLEDVGLDTYHHTFFEMLGNWSFGDYFKKEAIEWAWELVVGIWRFPVNRLYATVFCPDMSLWQESLSTAIKLARTELAGGTVLGLGDETTGGAKGSAAINFPDDEAAFHWAKLFLKEGLDPSFHILPGGRKDNFWMMGDTGPCGPCSELHVDLTPNGDTNGSLVNRGDARCIEIWNLVFMQFNANPDGTFAPLPARSVDTGMGFERVTSILQCTRNFTDFTRVISNYETDIFRPIFDKLEQLSGKKYGSTLPAASGVGAPPAIGPATAPVAAPATEAVAGAGRRGVCPTKEQIQIDIAFRVIADHIRTLSFAIADGIQPGNTDRSYVLRRILRRAVRYGRSLGFHEPFFYKLVDVLADTMGDVFPEIRARKKHVEEVIRAEEEAFNKTLDNGISMFNVHCCGMVGRSFGLNAMDAAKLQIRLVALENWGSVVERARELDSSWNVKRLSAFSGETAFLLYDTYGFPLDLTELMARERGLTVDVEDFNKLMEEQKARARAAQKKTVVELSQIETQTPTTFVGYDKLETPAKVLEVVGLKDKTAVILDTSACYAEMGGQVGDTGELLVAADVSRRTSPVGADSRPRLRITNTQKSGNAWLHFLAGDEAPAVGDEVLLRVDRARRAAIQRHHTVTHLLHWALHEAVSPDVSQKGSFVGADKLTFDFNHAPLTAQQVADVEKLVNERIVENAPVTWLEAKYEHIKDRKDVMQFFGEKYGEWVRVVQIGGNPTALDGYSMELCGGTHCRATGEIGLFRIVAENAIAAGVRRIEAIAGLEAWRRAGEEVAMLKNVAERLATPIVDLDKKIENLLAQQKELEKQLKAMQQKEAAGAAKVLAARATVINGVPAIVERFDADGETLQGMVNELKGQFKGVIVLGGAANNAVALIASVSPEFTAKLQAGKIIQQIAPIVGGKGGGRPDNARGGGKEVSKLDEALAKARSLLG